MYLKYVLLQIKKIGLNPMYVIGITNLGANTKARTPIRTNIWETVSDNAVPATYLYCFATCHRDGDYNFCKTTDLIVV